MPEINFEFRTKLRSDVKYKKLKISENYFDVLSDIFMKDYSCTQ